MPGLLVSASLAAAEEAPAVLACALLARLRAVFESFAAASGSNPGGSSAGPLLAAASPSLRPKGSGLATSGSGLHQGIATRSFERRSPLADFVIVQSAALENGLLTITLKREVPEAMKPRKLDISTTAQPASTTEKVQAQA